MFSCTRRIQFCAGHRVLQHESKCRNMHGHNYVAFITAESEGLDAIGRVIDFSVLKRIVGGWIDEHWDHGFILHKDDINALESIALFQKREGMRSKLYTMGENPTAENMAWHLKDIANDCLRHEPCRVTKVVLWETENCYAEA